MSWRTSFFSVGILFTKKLSRRLHKETNCGRHRKWHCILCGPNLLTADAYKKHLETEHRPAPEDIEYDFIMPTVEVTLNRNHNYNPIADFSKTGTNLDALSEDPLLFMLKDEKCLDAGTGSAQTMADQDSGDISNFLSEGTTTET